MWMFLMLVCVSLYSQKADTSVVVVLKVFNKRGVTIFSSTLLRLS